MSEELHDQVEAVTDEASFLKFVEALRQDRIAEETAQHTVEIDHCGRGPNGWENHSIDAFLEATSRWAEASDFGKTQGVSDDELWKKFANPVLRKGL